MSGDWKMIYLARRNPALAPEQFVTAWREHSALGRQCRNVQQRVTGVTQCARVPEEELQLPGAATDYDGVNLLRLRDLESASAIWSDPETLSVMRPDEPRVFSTYVREFSLVCREQVLREASGRTAAVSDICLIGFLRRRAGINGGAFDLACLDRGPLSQTKRVVYNEVHAPPPPGYDYDGICEWWFETGADPRRAFSPGADLRAQLPVPLARWFDLPRSVFIATRVVHTRP